MTEIVVAALYKFIALPDFETRKEPLLRIAQEAGVLGTILLAHEGVNGTIAGPREAVDTVLDYLRTFPGCADLQWKESYAEENPFYRIKVRLKKEIVTMGVTGIAPEKSHEMYVTPDRWNEVISDPDTVVIDTRNDYEVAIGSFDGAINPETKSFRDFPDWFRKFREENPVKKVAMFCTGGIRCEKSTAFLKSEGIDDVVHLQGGILKYLETVPEEKSKWRGECFVFDQRVSVGHDLAPGSYDQCFACRRPITDEDKASEHYIKGVMCPHCVEEYSPEQREGFAERQRQIKLAKERGETHIGVKAPSASRTDEEGWDEPSDETKKWMQLDPRFAGSE